MSIDDFMEGIHIIQDNYHKKLSKEQLRLYYENLKDMSKDRYISNIIAVIKDNPYLPNIAQIRNEQRKQYANYEQREYTDIDFDSLYAN